MASVFKRGGKSNRGGYWYVSWFDHLGNRRTKCSKTTDKAAAERIAARYESGAALRREGVIDPAEDRYGEQGRRPISEHLTEFKATLTARNNAEDYVEQAAARAESIVKACESQQITDLQASDVMQAIKRLQDRGKSLATCNSYLRSIKGFTRWLHRDKRLRHDPLVTLEKFNEATDQRRTRRELSADEFGKLLSAAQSYTAFRARLEWG